MNAESAQQEEVKHVEYTIRTHAMGWFLTYPRCPLSKQEVLEALQSLPGAKITEYVICEERHASGLPHLHAFVKYGKK
jgi:CMP-2-keto-3-deoxyoctulosonic acid synthetase